METLVTTNAGERRISLPIADPVQRQREIEVFDELFKDPGWNSNSMTTTASRCWRKLMYRYFMRLHPIGGGGGSLAMHYGSSMHMAIPIILSGGSVEEAFLAFRKLWLPMHDQMGDEKRNSTVAVKALTKYKQDRAASYFVLEKPPQNLQVNVPNPEDRSPWELRFAVMLPGSNIPFTGFIDGIARHKYTGRLYIYEFKTTSQLGATFNNSWPLNPQLLGYSYAAQVLYGEEVAGAVVEGLQSAKTKQENISIEQPVTQSQIADWVVFESYISQQIETMKANKTFPKMFTGCNPYPMFGSHGFKCEYQQLCQAADWTQLLPMFNVVDDDPYDLSRSIEPDVSAF